MSSPEGRALVKSGGPRGEVEVVISDQVANLQRKIEGPRRGFNCTLLLPTRAVFKEFEHLRPKEGEMITWLTNIHDALVRYAEAYASKVDIDRSARQVVQEQSLTIIMAIKDRSLKQRVKDIVREGWKEYIEGRVIEKIIRDHGPAAAVAFATDDTSPEQGAWMSQNREKLYVHKDATLQQILDALREGLRDKINTTKSK